MEERRIQPSDLKRIRLFGALHRRALTELIAIGTIRVYQPHDILYRAHTINKKLIIVLKGSLVIGYAFAHYDVPIEVLAEGDLWGYTTLLRPGKKYPYHVQNRGTVTEVIELPIAKVIRYVEQNHARTSPLVYELSQLQSQRSSQRQKKMSLLFGIATILNTSDSTKNLLKNILELLTFTLNAERALIASFDDTAKQIVIDETLNYGTRIAQGRYKLTADTLLSLVYNTDKPLLVTKKNFERKFRSAPYSRPSMMVAPLKKHGTVYGAVLCADKAEEQDFTSDDVLTLRAAAPMVTFALSSIHEQTFEKQEKNLKHNYILPLQRY